MTVRVTISVPDEVAAHAAGTGNASRFFTEAARAAMARVRDRAWMDDRGLTWREEGVSAAGAALGRARRQMTTEAWAAARQGPAALAAHRDTLPAPAAGADPRRVA